MLPLFALSLMAHVGVRAVSCQVEAQVPPPWKEGDRHVGVVNLTVSNTGDEALGVPWRLRVTNLHYGAVRQAWNLRVTEAAHGVVLGVAEDGNQVLAPAGAEGASVNLGFTVEADAPELMPEAVWVNDLPCVLTAVPRRDS